MLGIGPIISEALEAKERLKEKGINIAVASMGSVKPLDDKFLKQCISEGYTNWVSLEEHHKIRDSAQHYWNGSHLKTLAT